MKPLVLALFVTLAAAVMATMAPAAALAAATDDAVNTLAQDCKTVRSPATGKYLNKSGSSFQFGTTDAGQAERLFMKPARLGDFLLTDRNAQYLTRNGSANPAAAKPGTAAEWNITATQPSANTFRFRLLNRGTNTPLVDTWSVRQCVLWGLVCWNESRSEENFELADRPANECSAYPEITTNVSGNPDLLKGNVNAPVRGFIDAHSHITSYLFMGGKIMHGAAFHKYGVPYALPDSSVIHGPNGSKDIIGNVNAYGTPINSYDTRGWPDFPFWPNYKKQSDTHYYYKWLERSWLAGERMMVSYHTGNEALCQINQIVQTILDPTFQNANSCRDMDSIRLQSQEHRNIQDYIDAQSGGPGRGFFRLVTTPEQARQVMADGRLAVLQGVEISEVLDCGDDEKSISGLLGFQRDGVCTQAIVDQRLDELYNLGIRVMFVTHKFDNQFGGTILDSAFINIGNKWATGHYYGAKACAADAYGTKMDGLPFVGNIPALSTVLGLTGIYPNYPASDAGLCNTRGLSPLGVYLVNRMIDKKMIIDIDHLGEDSRRAVVAIAKSRGYAGLVSTHEYLKDSKELDEHGHEVHAVNHDLTDALNLGGFAAIYNAEVTSGKDRIDRYLKIVERSGYLPAVGLGTDASGLGGQARPRGGVSPLEYPFTTEFGLVFDKQKSGNRTFDLNTDGMAHYGLLADIVADYRRDADATGNPRIYNAIMNSAEGYLRMWERAKANTSTNYVNPL